VGEVYYKLNQNDKALPHWEAYAQLGEVLYSNDPENYDWIMERGWGANNLALLANRGGNYERAKTEYEAAISYFEEAAKEGNDQNIDMEIVNSLGGLAQATLSIGDRIAAKAHRNRQSVIYDGLLQTDPSNHSLKFKYAQSLSRLITEGHVTFDSSEINQILLQVCQIFEDLLEHDSNNLFWKSDYYLFLKTLTEQEEFYLLNVESKSLVLKRVTQLNVK